MAKRLVHYGIDRTGSGRPARRLMYNQATDMMEYQYAATIRHGRSEGLRTWITYAKVSHALWMFEMPAHSLVRLNGKVAF
jgi:hypothetical protein